MPSPLRHAVVIAALLIAAVVPAAEYTVDAYAPTGGDGSTAHPFADLQSAVNVAGAGDTVWVRPGTYRQGVHVHGGGRPGTPLVIAGSGGMPTFKGSVVVGGWQRAWGAVWRRDGWSVPSQQVFADGRSLQMIGPVRPMYDGSSSDGFQMIAPHGGGVGDLVPGSFCYDAAAHALYVRLPGDADPSTHQLEVSVEQIVLDLLDAHDVVLRDLAVRHSSSGSYAVGGGAVELGTRCRAERLDVQWCDFCGIHLAYGGSGAAVVGCTANNNGAAGMGADAHADLLIQGCDVSWNNTRGFNPFWHAGGIKITTGAWGRIVGCRFRGNLGPGVWLDYCDSGQPIAIERNDVEGNRGDAGSGVMVEGSSGASVVANLLLDNEERGVYVSASENSLVAANTVSGTRVGAAIDLSGMPRAGKRLAHLRVVDNLLIGNLGRDDLYLLRENGGDIVDLRVDHDLVWRDGGGARIWWGHDSRDGWAGVEYGSLAAWAGASGNGVSCVQADPRLQGWAPDPSSPAATAGTRVDGVDADYRGGAYADPPAIGALQPGPPLGEAWTPETWSVAEGPSSPTASSPRCGLATAAGALALALAGWRQRRAAAERSTSATRSGSPPADR